MGDFGTALQASIGQAIGLIAFGIPKLLGFLLFVIIGWFIASAVAAVVAGVLRGIKFNDLAQRSGFSGFVRNMGVQQDASSVLAEIAKWFIRLIALVAAFDSLGLPAVSRVLQDLLLFLPNLVVALVILVLAGLVAGAFANVVRGSAASAGLGNPDVLANVARIAVMAFAVVIAVNQIGIAATLVNTLFTAVVGALALALGLAFGLGGRDTAAQIVQGAYQKGQQAAPKLAAAAQAAGQQAGPTRPAVSAQPPADRPAPPRVVTEGTTMVVGPRGT